MHSTEQKIRSVNRNVCTMIILTVIYMGWFTIHFGGTVFSATAVGQASNIINKQVFYVDQYQAALDVNKALVNNHIYPINPPGNAVFMIPIIYIGSKIYDAFPEKLKDIFKRKIVTAYRTKLYIEASLLGEDHPDWPKMIFLSVFARAFWTIPLGAIIAALMWKFLMVLNPENISGNIHIALLTILGTPAFYYIARLASALPSTCLLMMALYLFALEESKKRDYSLAYGFLIGSLPLFYYSMFPVFYVMLGFHIYHFRKNFMIEKVILGASLPILFFLWYHKHNFGGYFNFSFHFVTHLPYEISFEGLYKPNIFAILRSLFSLRYGLFLYCPLLMIGAVFSFSKKMKKFKALRNMLICICFIQFLVLGALNDMVGSSLLWGSYWFIPIIPVLMAPLTFAWNKKNRYYFILFGWTLAHLEFFASTAPSFAIRQGSEHAIGDLFQYLLSGRVSIPIIEQLHKTGFVNLSSPVTQGVIFGLFMFVVFTLLPLWKVVLEEVNNAKLVAKDFEAI